MTRELAVAVAVAVGVGVAVEVAVLAEAKVSVVYQATFLVGQKRAPSAPATADQSHPSSHNHRAME